MSYVGTELELFQDAVNWKSYFASKLKPYLRGDVLEVGAGLGGTTRLLAPRAGPELRSWTCLEPDATLVSKIREALARGELPKTCAAEVGTLATLAPERRFDSVLYIDVLEHIEDDAREFSAAAGRLNPGGTLVVLSPAHQWLYTPFDKAIGHFRRYNKKTLGRLEAQGLRREKLCYLDSVGMLASAGNRLVLKSSMPNRSQIRLWDRLMVPLSRVVDPLLAHSLGKTVLGVWRRDGKA